MSQAAGGRGKEVGQVCAYLQSLPSEKGHIECSGTTQIRENRKFLMESTGYGGHGFISTTVSVIMEHIRHLFAIKCVYSRSRMGLLKKKTKGENMEKHWR